MTRLSRFTAALCGAVGLVALAAPAHANTATSDDPLPRIEDPLCPAVVGLQEGLAAQIVGRIRSNAESVGIPLADPETCSPTMLVAFVADGQAYLANVIETRRELFRDVPLAEQRRLLAQPGPGRAWVQVVARTRDGDVVGVRDNPSEPPQAEMWQAHSRITRAVRYDITYAMVLFDTEEVVGRTVEQLADYASLRAFSTVTPEADGAGSIATLFASESGQAEALTDFDRAWLTRLYEGPPNIPASTRMRGLRLAQADD